MRGRELSRRCRRPSASIGKATSQSARRAYPALECSRQKKTVPSDPTSSSFSDRHARSEHGLRRDRDFSLSLPAAAFGRPRINAPDFFRVCAAGSCRLGTDFRSPTVTALFRRPPRRGQCSCPIPSTLFPAVPQTRSVRSSRPRLALRLPGSDPRSVPVA